MDKQMTPVPSSMLKRSRGMRDLLPADMRAFRRVEDAFRAAALRWGYEEIRTPTLENYSLFTSAGALTPEMLARVYSFLDWDGWSGERVVLRPDSTIPVTRAAAEAGLPLPARLFYVQNRFRFAEENEEREDWQFGIEYLGAPESTGDLEVATVACETLEALGIRATVRLGHVGISRSVCAAAGISPADVPGASLTALKPLVASDPALAAFVDVACRAGDGTALLANLEGIAVVSVPAALPALQELNGIASALKESNRPVMIDLAMPRDFEYYSGAVFEFESGETSWGGGGRYSSPGAGMGATACGLGLEAGLLAAHAAPMTRARQVVSVIARTPADFGRAIALARALHRSGIAAALGDGASSAALAVYVGADGLVAHTPDGERSMQALDDVVGLLIQYK
jgi:histidyl-tRNA synthetase